MNRTIKFRVWDSELKIWINNIGMKQNNVLTNGNEKRFHVMQFTGLHDKNGKEIYEGDILKFIDWDKDHEDECPNIGAIFYDKDIMRFDLSNRNDVEIESIYFDTETEVIGNIYETPELLNP